MILRDCSCETGLVSWLAFGRAGICLECSEVFVYSGSRSGRPYEYTLGKYLESRRLSGVYEFGGGA